jgi:hypothetical protein
MITLQLGQCGNQGINNTAINMKDYGVLMVIFHPLQLDLNFGSSSV